jgi:hypothetical protein
LSPRTLRSALSTPAAHQRLIILPSRHRFTFLVVSRAIEIMLSMQFVFVRLAASGRRHRAAGR